MKRKMVQVVEHIWRFGYGSNIGLTNLKQKKNLNPSKYLAGTIQNWELYFSKGIAHVEPGFAAVRSNPNAELHGTAFCIPKEEADGLDRQERGYDVLPCEFVAYDGQKVQNVGLYVPKERKGKEEGIPSRRYLRLLQNGAKEAPLSDEWQEHLNSFDFYVTPSEIRAQTNQWIEEFHSDPERKDNFWTSEILSKHDGSEAEFPVHTSIMGYVIAIPDMFVFGSWKGHDVTRRNLVHFRGQSVDKNDIRFGEEGYRPFPKLSDCTEEEREYVIQNFDSVLHRGGKIVARLEDFVGDQTNDLN